MSAKRSRDGCLGVVLFAALLAPPLGVHPAWGAMGGGHTGLHASGSGGGRSVGGHVGGHPIANPTFGHHDVTHRHHGHRHFGGVPYVAYAPWDVYDSGYEYETEDSAEPAPRRSPSPGYCDVSSHFPQKCVWKDAP